MENKIVLKYMGEDLHTFEGKETVNDIIDAVKEWYDVNPESLILAFVPSGSDNTDKIIETEKPEEETKEEPIEMSESIAVDTPEKEYTIWSSADIVESGEQIPLVKIKVTDDGELEAEAVGDDDFDKESLKIATNSLKSTVGRSIRDRLLRVDKSLNHADPFFSTELYRDNIRANRGLDNKDISDATTNEDGSNQQGLQLLANQILLTNRDDLKAAANNKSANEDKIVDLFNQMTGVDYYTGKVIDQDQYNYILDLLGRSSDKYDDSHVAPDENMYVQNLKDLAEELIEKVLLKTDPDFYKRK